MRWQRPGKASLLTLMQEGKSQTYLELNYEAMIIEKHLTSDHIFF